MSDLIKQLMELFQDSRSVCQMVSRYVGEHIKSVPSRD